jgi:small subunit ribosomal protein S3
MGQKASPKGLRIPLTKQWVSNWYANKGEFGYLLMEDKLIRDYLMKKPACVGTSKIEIRRMSGKIEITIHTARPGLVIGKRGGEIDELKKQLTKFIGKDVWIEVSEIKRPDLDAQLVADGIAAQIKECRLEGFSKEPFKLQWIQVH